MNKKSKLVLILLLLVVTLPAGIVAFAAIGEETQSPTSQQIYESTEKVVIPRETLERIKAFDPAGYERHLADYKQTIVELRISHKLQAKIEDLLEEGYSLTEILVGYEFLSLNFGTIEQLQELLDKKQDGDAWANLFVAYHRDHPPFSPRSFDSGLLEQLMNAPLLNADDIMIADRISFVTGKAVEEIFESRKAGTPWHEITSEAGILFGDDKLPRVQVTNDQLQKLQNQTGWTDDRITAAIVTAHQAGQEPEKVVEKLKRGTREEAILAEAYETKHR
ncbi:hypothetical protein [Cohnella cellulosilytica]|uniref:Uncharacterized protein n=1 Tax=Cohnella cellulosilytica TaxID=986710 RepID=A0ABW2FHF0_9BACL